MLLNPHRLTGLAVLGLLICAPIHAHAEPITSSPGFEAENLAGLQTGDQFVLEAFSGALAFAGTQLDLDNFSGVLGYASASAYVVAIEGSARIGNAAASRGRMLLITPHGQDIVTERFDAQRLHDALSGSPRSAEFDAMLTSLANLASGQATSIYIGRLTQTNFNVATLGSAEAEQARRSILGDEAVRNIRFSSLRDSVAIEAALARTFAEALRAQDTETIASLLDPTPFGGTDLRGGASVARTVAARRLIEANNWSETLNAASMEPQGEPGLWHFATPNGVATIATRPVGEFVFVTSASLKIPNEGVRP